jgi:predicted DCC family thiol-disulfide oxidoreductase YuxK
MWRMSAGGMQRSGKTSVARLRNSLQSRLILLVFYDGWCTMCRNIAECMSKLDWFHLVQWVSFRDPRTIFIYGLEEAHYQERICSSSCQSARIYEGIDTLVGVCARVPVCWPLLPFLVLGRYLGVARPLYDRLARRRMIASTPDRK